MSVEYLYPYEAEDIANLLMDPDYLKQRAKAVGEKNVTTKTFTKGDKTIVKRHLEKELDLPQFLKRLFNPLQVVEITEEWQSTGLNFVGKAVYDAGVLPVSMETETIVQDTEEGCAVSIHFFIKVNMPIIGKRVEKFIVSNFVAGADKAFGFLADYLEEQE